MTNVHTGEAAQSRSSARLYQRLYASLPGGMVLAPWRTPVEGWDVVNGRPLPGPTAAIYELPEGPDRYVEGRFVPGSLAHNVPPGA